MHFPRYVSKFFFAFFSIKRNIIAENRKHQVGILIVPDARSASGTPGWAVRDYSLALGNIGWSRRPSGPRLTGRCVL